MARRVDKSHKHLLGTILPLLRFAPPALASRLVAGLGRAEFGLLPGSRRRIETAVDRYNKTLNGGWDVRSVGRSLLGNTVLWQARDLLLDNRRDDRVSNLFEVVGRDRLDAARDGGKGVILLCNHFGAHMHPAHWVARQGYPLRLFMERPRTISRYLSKAFDSEGPDGQRKLFISRKANPAESAGSILRACRVIQGGAILYIAGDVRWTGQLSTKAKFLGRTHSLSTTWVTLAALTGAPVVPVFCTNRPDGTFLLEFLDGFRVDRSDHAPDRSGRWVDRYLIELERRVVEHPENSNEYFFWEGSDEPEE